MDSAFERHCSELVARERSGHTAVVEDSLLYVWGGYMSVADDEVFLPNDEIWAYDLEQGSWKVFHMPGEVPPSMSGTCSCSLDGHMYIFGGCDDFGQTNQIYCVNLTDGKYTWRKITHQVGSAPSPRDKLMSVYLSCKSSVLIHKSVYKFPVLHCCCFQVGDIFWGWNNEVHTFDPMHSSWSQPQTHGRAPAPRAAHASATIGRRGYICGGRVMETRTNDIHCLDLESWTWSEIVPASSTPVGRSWHTLTAVSDNGLFLFGGLSVDCKPMSDGWLFDVETKTWREVEHPFKTKPRLWHSACPGKDSDVIVFGGSCDYILLVDTKCKITNDSSARNSDPLRHQLPLLPSKLLTAVQTRMCFYRPSKRPKSESSKRPKSESP
uniref:Kelch domain-containing protein 1-like n=1 Tax=Labrus bergylta TaxID=56723 RepID=A0A3Q3E452_9LABR